MDKSNKIAFENIKMLTTDEIESAVSLLNKGRDDKARLLTDAVSLVATIMDKIGYIVVADNSANINGKTIYHCFPK